MRNRPVFNLTMREINTCISIIRLLREGGLKVNKIIEQTSSDRTHVIEMIDLLKKANIVTKPKVRWGQSKVVNLTDIGNQLINLMVNVREYTQSWEKLDEAMAKRFDIPYKKEKKEVIRIVHPNVKRFPVMRHENIVRIIDEKTLPTVLKNRGWSEDEVDQFLYDKCRPPHGMSQLLDKSPWVVINIILYKYSILIMSELNDAAKSIIQKIIIDLITDVADYIQIPRYPQETPEADRMLDEASNEAMSQSNSVMSMDGFFYRFMNPEVFGLLGSIFAIVNPRRVYLEDAFDRYTRFVTQEKLKAEKDENYYYDEGKARILEFLQGLLKKYN